MASNSTHQILPYAPLSSSSRSTPQWKYDVFLSFRGEDTRKKFTDHLYAALRRNGINTFRDDNELRIGEEIGPELRKAIEESRFYIIVLSKNYASSTWCLDELVHILKCRKTPGHEVWPVFYDIDPSSVRKQGKSFVVEFENHEKRFKDDMKKVTRWRVALKEVADLKGLDVQNHANGHESSTIDDIVKEIFKKLDRKKLWVATHPIGLGNPAKDLIFILSNDPLDVCIVGICGMGGLGKTTIAKEVFNSIYREFEASCFLANVRANSDSKGMIELQRQLLSEIVMPEHEEIYNVDRGLKVIEERCCKKVLIVLDDVDELNQLNQILGDRSWLFPGSRVIITTRIPNLLETSRLYKQYYIKKLNHDESLQLLSLHAFNKDHPEKDYLLCAKEVVSYANGIPLVLEVLGSSLIGKDINEWNRRLKDLEVRSDQGIHEKLKISYDSLDDTLKHLFLDIACFLVGFDNDHVKSILCDSFSIEEINELLKRRLISVDFTNKLMMHDLLRDMGREIVRQEDIKDPGKRSRLWRPADAFAVLKDETGTREIQGLILDLHELSTPSDLVLRTKAFKEMKILWFLKLNYVCITGSFKKFSRQLRWLCWHGFPLGSVPADLCLGYLVSLDMQYSKLKQFQEDVMDLNKLKFLDLSHSHELTKIFNFERFPNLEILSLEDCTSLVELHDSIRVLMRLHSLNLQGCKILSLPRSIRELSSLKNLNISYCSKAIENSENLELTASPREGPHIFNLLVDSLDKLDLSYCNLFMIPNDLSKLAHLQTLSMMGNNFSHLPASIGSLSYLKKMFVSECRRLQSVPELPSQLRDLKAENCLSLESINLVNIQKKINGYVRHDLNCEVDGCQNLKVVQGYYSLGPFGVEIVENIFRARSLCTAESIASIRMRMMNNFTHTSCISPLQALSEGGIYSIFLPLREIPSRFSYQSDGNKIFLQVPALEQCCKIIGLILCVVYESIFPRSDEDIYLEIIIETKKFIVEYKPTVFYINEDKHDVMWLSNWTFEMDRYIGRKWRFQDQMEEGEQLIVLIREECGIKVKRCGIQLLYGHNDQASQSNDLATISYAYPSPPVINVHQVPHFSWSLTPRALQGKWLMKYFDDDDDDEWRYPYRIQGRSTNAQRENIFFSRIQAIDAPGEMKHFLCCCLSGIFPVQEVLNKRGRRADGCGFCAETETLDHLLLQCPFAQAVWLSSPLQLDLKGLAPAPQSFMHWLLDLSDRWKLDEYEDEWRLVAFTVWMIWKARNDLLYRAMTWDPISISCKIADSVSKYIDASRREIHKMEVNSMTQVNRIVDDDCLGYNRWMKPPFNLLKLNIHVSWNTDEECGSVGAVIRDHYGMFIAAMSKKLIKFQSVRKAKAEAVLEVLRFCADHGLKGLIVEGGGDVLRILNFDKDHWQYAVATYVLAKEVLILDFNFVTRDQNRVAHTIAFIGRHVEDFEEWLEDPPAWLEYDLLADL